MGRAMGANNANGSPLNAAPVNCCAGCWGMAVLSAGLIMADGAHVVAGRIGRLRQQEVMRKLSVKDVVCHLFARWTKACDYLAAMAVAVKERCFHG